MYICDLRVWNITLFSNYQFMSKFSNPDFEKNSKKQSVKEEEEEGKKK